jgi:hypothetical protein
LYMGSFNMGGFNPSRLVAAQRLSQHNLRELCQHNLRELTFVFYHPYNTTKAAT